eukprot:Tbor_TRINITY_DN5991_c5_g7::TRINITY_DN5991_c5_g7_i1::g.19131::m.19131/K00573/E2.1.1.77, pcm; protein-L-isoaspartate(D-aspartate) O-methyltransferase
MSWRSHGVCNPSLVEALTSAKLIISEPVKQAFLQVDRSWFVPLYLQDRAYLDQPLPIGHNVTISAPHMHAQMAELVYKHLLISAKDQPNPSLHVLDVGSGTGFLTAVLSRIVESIAPSLSLTHSLPCKPRVYGIEHVPQLVDSSNKVLREKCAPWGVADVIIIKGDGRIDSSYPPDFPAEFDAIHVGAAAPGQPPSALLKRLKPNGCLVIPIDEKLHVIKRSADGKGFSDSVECGVRFVPLTSLDVQLKSFSC